MNLSNKVALVERRIKENKGNKYDPATEARLEWSQLKKAKGIVDKDREARKKAYFDKQREEAKKAKEAKDKPKPKIVVKAIVKKKRLENQNGKSSNKRAKKKGEAEAPSGFGAGLFGSQKLPDNKVGGFGNFGSFNNN
jgi:hypothetical protein